MTMKQGLPGVDTFDRRVAEMGLDGRPAGAPAPAHVICEEPKTGIWSGNSNLGIEAPFAIPPPGQVPTRQTILKMPEWGFPETWTISLGIESKPVFRSAFNGRNITAIIEFGVGGFTQTIVVDWKLGTQITLVTNSINVIAEFASVDVDLGEGDFKLSVQLCRGNRPSSALAPTKTLVIPAVADGDVPANTVLEGIMLTAGQTTGIVDIPFFATMLHIMPAVVAAILGSPPNLLYAASTIISVTSGPGAGSTRDVFMTGADLLALGSKIPIFGSCLQVQITNFAVGPTDFVGFSLFAELAG